MQVIESIETNDAENHLDQCADEQNNQSVDITSTPQTTTEDMDYSAVGDVIIDQSEVNQDMISQSEDVPQPMVEQLIDTTQLEDVTIQHEVTRLKSD